MSRTKWADAASTSRNTAVGPRNYTSATAEKFSTPVLCPRAVIVGSAERTRRRHSGPPIPDVDTTEVVRST